MPRVKKRIEYDDIVRQFGNQLRILRTKRGMTQAELAEAASVSVAYVGRLERGGAAPGIDLVAKLAHALGMPSAEFFVDTPSTNSTEVYRERAKRLFEEIVQRDDDITLSLLVQLLALVVESRR